MALQKCRAEVRNKFVAHATEADAARISKLVADAHDAAAFLGESIVQAQLTPEGRYGEHARASVAEALTLLVFACFTHAPAVHKPPTISHPRPEPKPRSPARAAMKIQSSPAVEARKVEVRGGREAAEEASMGASGGERGQGGQCSKPSCGCA